MTATPESPQTPGERPEADVAPDEAAATSRPTTDAEPVTGSPDAQGTTGSGPNEEFVGRVQGQDAGYAGETGAERRADG